MRHKKTLLLYFSECTENNRVKLDIGFVMDVSGSITKDGWEKEKMVAKQIAGLTTFGIDGTQAGVVTFETNAKIGIKLSDHVTKSSFESSLDRLHYSGGGTDILKGLDTALTQIFNPSNGMRADSKRVTVLITDGQDGSTASQYEAMAKRFEQRGIRLKVIGVGNVNEKQLKLLVKDDSDLVHGDAMKQFLESDHGFNVNDIC